jgi:hypothetical protein
MSHTFLPFARQFLESIKPLHMVLIVAARFFGAMVEGDRINNRTDMPMRLTFVRNKAFALEITSLPKFKLSNSTGNFLSHSGV